VLLKDFASYLREKANDPAVHIINRSDTADEEQNAPLQTAEPRIASAKLVEGDKLAAVPVGAPADSRLTHFLDGVERTHLPCYWSMSPALYAYTAAVVRERGTDRSMRTWRCASDESLFFPFAHIDPTDMWSRGLRVVDTYENGETVDEHPGAMIDRARKAVNRTRSALESGLAREWVESCRSNPGVWLVVDGSLTEVVDSAERLNVIGIIKSHQTQYFGLEDQRRILSLAAGERSSVFAVVGRKRMGAYSWYLRLHPNTGRDVYFGLIRVEATPFPETIEMADDISRWLLAERAPLSLPDSRWDRLMYPIRDCEQYLRSIAPTRVMLEAAFSGL